MQNENLSQEQLSILRNFANHPNSQEVLDYLDSKNLFHWFKDILLEVAE